MKEKFQILLQTEKITSNISSEKNKDRLEKDNSEIIMNIWIVF